MKNLTKNPPCVFILLALIFAIALLIRLYPVIKTPETFRGGLGLFSDSLLYHDIAYNLYIGNGFSRTTPDHGHEPEITRAPGYPVFIALIYRTLGNEKDMGSLLTWHKNLDKVRIAQCFFDAIVCVLVFFISRAICSNSFLPGLIAAGLYCFSFYNIYYTKVLLCESITTFLLTASLLFCILGSKHNKTYLWVLAGVLFGGVILTRQEYLLFPGIFMLYLIFEGRHDLNTVKKPLVFLVAAATLVLPWTIRNYYVFKQIIPIAAGELGANMLLGTCETNNNWQGWVDLPSCSFDSKEEQIKAQSLYNLNEEIFPTGSIKIKEPDNALMTIALERIKKHPFECLTRWVIKIPRLWYQFYIPMYGPYIEKEASGGFFIFYFIFAVTALWKSPEKERKLMAPIVLLFLYLNLLLLPLHVEPRFGVPLMPGIICLASVGIWKIIMTKTLLSANGVPDERPENGSKRT